MEILEPPEHSRGSKKSKQEAQSRNKAAMEMEKSFAKSQQENQSMKNDLEEQYKALMEAQMQMPIVVEEEMVQKAMDNPQAFILESRE